MFKTCVIAVSHQRFIYLSGIVGPFFFHDTRSISGFTEEPVLPDFPSTRRKLCSTTGWMEPDGILLVTCGNVLTRIWTVVANRVPWLSLLLSLISRLNSLRFFSVGLFELGDFCNKIEWFMRVTAENHRRDDEFSSLDLEHYYFLLA